MRFGNRDRSTLSGSVSPPSSEQIENVRADIRDATCFAATSFACSETCLCFSYRCRRCTLTLTDENFKFYTHRYFSVTRARTRSDTLRCLRAPVWEHKIYTGLSKFARGKNAGTRERVQQIRNKRFIGLLKISCGERERERDRERGRGRRNVRISAVHPAEFRDREH